MKFPGVNEIREAFLSFFESKGHLRLPGASLVPVNDKSLLLINSGMAPLKTYFTGQETPPRKRVATCQKCVRTGDIDEVGKDGRHCSFFEMLGNFSFGDYFKKEAIPWAWEFLTQVIGLSPDRLYITIYEDDDEAYGIWTSTVNLPPERIRRLGKADNFWEHGVGPCGPCSEIHYDRGDKYACGKESCGVGCDCDRYMEIWNLVFTQFNKEQNSTYTPLDFPNIDTGMGLERIAMAAQDAASWYDLDTAAQIVSRVCETAGIALNKNAEKDESIRIITDHIRSVVFMTADGVMPSNEGRGYIMRRLLRRAARHGRRIGLTRPFLADVCETVVAVSGEAYPALKEKQAHIKTIIQLEESRFYETLDQGLEILHGHIAAIGAEKTLSGKAAFQLYDTFGFPPDLTREILAEHGFIMQEDEFLREMENQRERARAAREESTYMGARETVYHQLDTGLITKFVGYDRLAVDDAKIIALAVDQRLNSHAEASGAEISVLLDKTPFYAESGGQKGDFGVIRTQTGEVEVTDCVKVIGGRIAHIGTITHGFIQDGQTAVAEVNEARRLATARNHSATHLLQKALRETLGGHVEQAGSQVSAERLRFDFTHFAPVGSALRDIEALVNEKILAALPIRVLEKPIEEAREMGATALFGEKYGDIVRVVDMDGYSVEFCGGTHLSNTAQIGLFTILSESGVAAGVRRVEAVTGEAALTRYRETENNLTNMSALLKTSADNLMRRVQALLDENKELRATLEKSRARQAGGMAEEILAAREIISGFACVAARCDELDMNGLRALSDTIYDKLQNGVILLAGVKEGKCFFLARISENAVAAGAHAGELVKEAAAVCGGGGGGKPNMAQAGGKDISKIDAALQAQKKLLSLQLK